MKTQKKRVLSQISLVLCGLVGFSGVLSAPSMAKGGGSLPVIAAGSCSAGSTWKLKAKNDNRQIEVEFEVNTNVAGQTWSNVIHDNLKLVFKGNRVTVTPTGYYGGDYTIYALTRNQAGDDVITAKAKNLTTKETCIGTVTVTP